MKKDTFSLVQSHLLFKTEVLVSAHTVRNASCPQQKKEQTSYTLFIKIHKFILILEQCWILYLFAKSFEITMDTCNLCGIMT